MSNISVGERPIKVADFSSSRYSIRFQNAGDTFIYLQRIPLSGAYTNVSPSDFEVVLAPLNSQTGSPGVFETRSILAYQAVAGKCCHIPDPCHHEDDGHDNEKSKRPQHPDDDCHCKKCYGLLAITETRKRIC